MIEARDAAVAEATMFAAQWTMVNTGRAKVTGVQAIAKGGGEIGTVDHPQTNVARIAEDGACKSKPHDQVHTSKEVVQRGKDVSSEGIDGKDIGGGEPKHAAEGIAARKVGIFGEKGDHKAVEEEDQDEKEDQRVEPGIVGNEVQENAHGDDGNHRLEAGVGFERVLGQQLFFMSFDEGDQLMLLAVEDQIESCLIPRVPDVGGGIGGDQQARGTEVAFQDGPMQCRGRVDVDSINVDKPLAQDIDDGVLIAIGSSPV